jgi:hypothetical protein
MHRRVHLLATNVGAQAVGVSISNPMGSAVGADPYSPPHGYWSRPKGMADGYWLRPNTHTTSRSGPTQMTQPRGPEMQLRGPHFCGEGWGF